jgi:Domain of unknown function (DUF4296)
VQKYSTLLILLFFFACSPSSEKDKIPDDIIPQEKMVTILSDMHIAETMARNTIHLGDTNVQKVINYYAIIYKKNNISELAFKKSYDYYIQHPLLLDSVYSEIINQLSEKQMHMKVKK